MSCLCAPSLLKLKKQIDLQFPNRDRSSDGCCGDPAHASRKSDHNPTNGYAHALDIDEDLGLVGNTQLSYLVPLLLADERTKYIIYERFIYYAQCTAHGRECTGHNYTGVNAHEHHLHISIKLSATHDTVAWNIAIQEDEEVGFQLESFRHADGRIFLHAPGYWKHVDEETWKVYISKNLANPTFQPVNDREIDVLKAGAWAGEEPEQQRAAD